MKKILLVTLSWICLGLSKSEAQSSPATLDVVSWNVEFFGAPYNSGPADKDLQEANVKNILNWINADLYGLLEVVDTMRLRRVVDFLGNNEFGFFVAPYCSGNTTGTGNGWLSGQKQAYIYRKSVFSNVTVRGLMRNSPTAYTNWASGRFPYMLSATATINGVSRDLNFILLHGKAGSTLDDFTKRTGACNELKDTLDTYFSTSNYYIIGDFNDALHTSIYPGSAVSSYVSIVADSTDSDHYKSVTLPLGVLGQTSMINFPNVIDNHIVSNEVAPIYIPGSAAIRTNVTTIVPNYVTAHNTSDHYPVFSQYNLSGVVTGIPLVTANELGVKVSPNPFRDNLVLTATKTQRNVTLKLVDMTGQTLQSGFYPLIQAGSVIRPPLPASLPRSVYFLYVENGSSRAVIKLVHL